MKNQLRLLSFAFSLTANASDRDKLSPTRISTETPSLTSTPYSPVKNNSSMELLPTKASDERLTPTFEIVEIIDPLQQELLIAQRNHKKLFERLEKDKQHFFTNQ